MKKDISEFIETEDSVQKSSIGFISSTRLPSIIQQFNQEDNSTRQRLSILKNINFFGISLFKYRILASDELRLVQRNGIPELAAYSGKYQRRKKVSGHYGSRGPGFEYFAMIPLLWEFTKFLISIPKAILAMEIGI